MTVHLTASGLVVLDNQMPQLLASGPGYIVAEDGDGHFDTWRYTGERADAVAVIAPIYLFNDGRYVIVDDGGLTATPTPEDFWLEEENGDFRPNLAKYPNVVAY